MPQPLSNQPPDAPVRISFVWIIIGMVAVVILGITGGIVAQQFFRNPLPLRHDTGQIINTVQELTISPNTAAAQVVERANRSVVLLGQREASTPVIVGTGAVVTNDGVLVTSVVSSDELVAYDHEGRSLSLEKLGNDTLYGLAYYRIASNVVIPLDLRQSDSPTGQELLMLTRNANTFQPRVKNVHVTEYVLPTGLVAPGLQRLIMSTPLAGEDLAIGSPLLDEEGKIAALLRTPGQGIGVPVSSINASLQRLTNNQREFDPFATLGLDLTYGFRQVRANEGVVFVAEVTNVTPTLPASVAGLTKGDVLIAVQQEKLDWQHPVAARLSASLPLTLQILRKGAEQTITLQAQPASL